VSDCRIKIMLLGTCAASALAAALVALPTAAAAQTSGDQSGVETVVVTAEKRAESLQTVPDSVTAISAVRLQNEAANGLQDYFREVPGLVLTQGSQGTDQLSIRGVTASGFTGPTVGIYVDDTPIGTSVSADHASSLVPDLDPSDIQQVEVLRGPQGTLYGATNIGGLLKYVTVLPNLEDYSGRIEVDGSSVYHGGLGYVLRGAFNGPIVTDELGITASGYIRQDPGFISDTGAIDNTQTNQDLPSQNRKDINTDHDYGGRVAALWKLNNDLSLRVSALYQYAHNDGQDAENIDGYTQQPTNGDLNNISSQYTGASIVKLGVYNASVNWDMHWASLLSSTSYADNYYTSLTDITGLVPPSPTSGFPPAGYPPFIFPNAGISYFTTTLAGTPPFYVGSTSLSGPYFTAVDLAYQTHKVTEELRLTSPAGQAFEWQLGFFYTNEDTEGTQDLSLRNPANGAVYPVTGICAPPPGYSAFPHGPPTCAAIYYQAPAGAVFDHSLAKGSYVEEAGYADATYHFTDQLSLQAGIRYSENQQTANPNGEGVLNVVSGGPYTSPPENSKGSGNDVTWLVSPQFKINDDAMVYGRIATGYRPGGVNSLAPGSTVATTFNPDTTTDYEIGSKSTLLGGMMTFDMAAYLIDWNNVQLQAINPQDEFFFANGKDARSQGLEFESTIVPTDGLTIRANAAYNNAFLTGDIPLSEGVVGFKGDSLPYAPMWSGALSVDYTTPVAADWFARFGGDFQYEGADLVDFYSYPTPGSATPLPPPRARLSSYGVFNLRAGVTHGPWDVTFFIKNVGNATGFSQESVQHATYGLSAAGTTVPGGKFVPDSATPILPRTFGITIVRNF
jgi:iron complex outermembrane recepter protein